MLIQDQLYNYEYVNERILEISRFSRAYISKFRTKCATLRKACPVDIFILQERF